MNTNFQLTGEWFLPSAKEKRISGILSFESNEASSLKLFGSFNNIEFLRTLNNEEIIQGITSDSKQVTLYGCFISHAGGITLVKNEETGTPITI